VKNIAMNIFLWR